MIEVTVHIEAILMMTDESALALQFGRDYKLKKLSLDELKNKDLLQNAKGEIASEYKQSILDADELSEFIVIVKDDILKLAIDTNSPECLSRKIDGAIQYSVTPEVAFYTPPELPQQLENYKGIEYRYLNDAINLLKMVNSGNIGFKDVFFNFNWKTGLLPTTNVERFLSATRNFVDERMYILTEAEARLCNNAINRIASPEFNLLRHPIEQFSWALEQVDEATKLVLFITALEMLLLNDENDPKKECLAKRSCVVCGNNDTEIKNTYDMMKKLYKYRSDYVHEGMDNNITQGDLIDLENICRSVLSEAMDKAKDFLQNTPNGTMTEFKADFIGNLKGLVTQAICNGVLPQ